MRLCHLQVPAMDNGVFLMSVCKKGIKQNDMEKRGGLRATDIVMDFVPVGDHVCSPLPDESLGKIGW